MNVKDLFAFKYSLDIPKLLSESIEFETKHYVQMMMNEYEKANSTRHEFWCVINNTDLNEGRGQEYIQYVCENKQVAIRKAHKAGIRGGNAQVYIESLPMIQNILYVPALIERMNSEERMIEDRKIQQQKIEEQEKSKKYDKMKALSVELGLTEEQLAKLIDVCRSDWEK